jgi:hypothetical protein
MASEFETWQVLALGKIEVFLAQRKIPSLLIVTTVLSLQREQTPRPDQTHMGGCRDAVEELPLLFVSAMTKAGGILTV